jgi:hypothetical protein
MRIWQIFFRRRGNPKLRASAVKHPVIGDYHTVVTRAGVSVIFNPTNSTYIFYRLSDNNVIPRLGPISFAGVQHARHNTGDYPSDEVQDIAQQIALDYSSAHFCQFFPDETASTHPL